jgi:uncharacterized protein
MPDLECCVLTLDQLEAIRLADLEGDHQERAAAKMNVSRPTFGRVLDQAHKTIADALLNGKALQISGGPVRTTRRGRVRCSRCRCTWEVPLPAAEGFHCPRCPDKHD